MPWVILPFGYLVTSSSVFPFNIWKLPDQTSSIFLKISKNFRTREFRISVCFFFRKCIIMLFILMYKSGKILVWKQKIFFRKNLVNFRKNFFRNPHTKNQLNLWFRNILHFFGKIFFFSILWFISKKKSGKCLSSKNFILLSKKNIIILFLKMYIYFERNLFFWSNFFQKK